MARVVLLAAVASMLDTRRGVTRASSGLPQGILRSEAGDQRSSKLPHCAPNQASDGWVSLSEPPLHDFPDGVLGGCSPLAPGASSSDPGFEGKACGLGVFGVGVYLHQTPTLHMSTLCLGHRGQLDARFVSAQNATRHFQSISCGAGLGLRFPCLRIGG